NPYRNYQGIQFQNGLPQSIYCKYELIIWCPAPCKLLCGRGNTEKGRERFHFNGFPIRQKLKNAKPAVTTVAIPSAAHSLGVKHHLLHALSTCILIGTKSHIALEIIGLSDMPGKDHFNITGRLHELFEDGRPIIRICQ